MRHPLPHSRLLVAFFFSVLLPLQARAQSGCPPSAIEMDGRYIFTLATARDTTLHAANRTGSASLDLKAGAVGAVASADGSMHMVARGSDDFMVTGLPMGTHVTVSVELVASLRAYKAKAGQGKSSARASLVAQWGQRVDRTIENSVENPVLALPLTLIAGVPFNVTAEVRADADQGSASAEAAYRFVGLPPGAMITSCHGFAGGGAVPSHPVYWGEIKSRYRR